MNTPEDLSPEIEIDLTNCDREPIHLLGRVQAYGCLLGISHDWMVTHASVNTKDLIGLEAEDLVGERFVEAFGEETLQDIRARLQTLQRDRTSSVRIFRYDLFRDERRFDISLHVVDRTILLEFEPRSDAKPREDVSIAYSLMGRVREKDTVEGMCEVATRGLRTFSGFDRVMVYRFEEDGSGSVIAESHSGGGDSYLGLRYPASDIPRQARELYVRNPLRIIADVNGKTYPIHPERGPTGRPLDLSMAVTRAVSPIHIEYLRNMGVGASLSVSITRNGQLWGMFACHHSEPIDLDFERRSAIELFGMLFTYELAQLEQEMELAEVARARVLHDDLMAQATSGVDLIDNFDTIAERIGEVVACDGIAIFSNNEYKLQGKGLSKDEFLPLARFLNTTTAGTIFHTSRLATVLPSAEDYRQRVSGVLALPISRIPRDYILLYRREVTQTVTWAGNPEKPVESGPNGVRLTPRKSFEAWKQTVHGASEPWKPQEVRAAEALRITLLEVVLKLSDEANAAQRRAQEQQELLIAELNHRVRNILNLIRGLVSQGRNDAATLEHYSADLDARIYALARAHDQLTQKSWGWVALRTLIQNEIRAFLDGKSNRVAISGDDVEVSPTALTTMALVLHEMVTNSAKYGALSDSSGSVDIDLCVLEDGALRIGWKERDGPPVKPPSRVGFGTKIIERSIPYELKGRAKTAFLITGLEAEFIVPANHIRPVKSEETSSEMPVEQPDIDEAGLDGHAMVVEDNMIIAMDAADILTDMGAVFVHTANGVAEALKVLDNHDVCLALIDVNLGGELSLPVAQECARRGIPTVLATGYGAAQDVIDSYPPIPILQKPYSTEQLREAMLSVLGGPGEPA